MNKNKVASYMTSAIRHYYSLNPMQASGPDAIRICLVWAAQGDPAAETSRRDRGQEGQEGVAK